MEIKCHVYLPQRLTRFTIATLSTANLYAIADHSLIFSIMNRLDLHTLSQVLKTLFNFLTDNIEAFYDIWILGDTLVKDTIDSLHALKRKAVAVNLPGNILFLLKMFNVRDYTSGSGYSGLACMLHPLVQGLNACHRLPKYILIMPDKDILVALHKNNINVALVILASLHYLIKQMDITISCRVQDLETKKLGALLKEDMKIIWIRMLKHPTVVLDRESFFKDEVTPSQAAFNLWGKFNSILEEHSPYHEHRS